MSMRQTGYSDVLVSRWFNPVFEGRDCLGIEHPTNLLQGGLNLDIIQRLETTRTRLSWYTLAQSIFHETFHSNRESNRVKD